MWQALSGPRGVSPRVLESDPCHGLFVCAHLILFTAACLRRLVVWIHNMPERPEYRVEQTKSGYSHAQRNTNVDAVCRQNRRQPRASRFRGLVQALTPFG